MAGASAPAKSAIQSLLTQLDEIERGPGGGTLTFPDGRLEVTNLGKPYWPGGSDKTRPPHRRAGRALTKGDLLRHYVRVAPMILPVLADRPLVMKRYPNGIAAPPFYQHRAPDKVPAGVRIEKVTTATEIAPEATLATP